MKKRVFSLLLAILILAAQIPFAFAVTASGTCGDNLTWTLDDSGTLTISGTGKMDDYDFSPIVGIRKPTPWPYNNIRTVLIDNGVTNIGDFAFLGCQNLTNIMIPNSVISIGADVFGYCNSLTSVTIPNSVISIGREAFMNCDSLTNITIPNSLTSIGDAVLWNCGSLINITIPNSVISIGYEAFMDCDSLTNITIPNSVTSIGEAAFMGCDSLTNITIPNSVASIGESAFYGCANLKNIYYSGSQQQLEALDIGHNNEGLTNATIHYNSSGSDSVPITPTPVAPESFPPESQPVTPTPQTNNAISKYSYAFPNEGKAFGYPAAYRFPLERFQLVYGDGFAKKMKAVDFGGGAYWSGNCYGIATTAAMLSRAGSGVTPSDFRDGATRPGELQVSDSAAKLGLTLAQFIEAMQISQYSATFAATRKQNRDNLSGLLSAMSAFEEGGFGPLVICVYGNDKNGAYSGHALLAYHLDGQRLYVYDCNHPNDESRYITISNSGWSYPISDGVTWNNSNGDITYT